MSFEEGALCEPLSVALQGIARTGVKAGDAVTVFGAGTIGLLVDAVAKAGSAKVTIIGIPCKAHIEIDLDRKRLNFALSYCAESIIQLDRSTGDPLEAARSNSHMIRSKSHPPDVIFECTGAPSCLQTAIYVYPCTQKLMAGSSTW